MEIAVTQFKAHALSLLEKVHQDGQPLVVLKRGKPLVKVLPAFSEDEVMNLEGTILAQEEDIFSTGEEWDAEQ